MSLFNEVGGRPTLVKVHKIFYDKVYAHAWVGQFFKDVPQDFIESQQTDFMTRAMGGPAVYCGRVPEPAHRHMYITVELFDLRHALLVEAIREVGVETGAAKRWLKIDAAFRGKLTKGSLSECTKRFHTDKLIVHPNPAERRTA